MNQKTRRHLHVKGKVEKVEPPLARDAEALVPQQSRAPGAPAIQPQRLLVALAGYRILDLHRMQGSMGLQWILKSSS